MSQYCIGNYIHDLRKEKGYTQEDLAFGICSAGTLSKIENGKQAPSVSTYEALMQRLGVSPQLFSVYVSRDELENWKRSRKILWMLATNQWQELQHALNEYEKHIKEPSVREKQFLIYIRAIMRSNHNQNAGEILQELQQALALTVPRWRQLEQLRGRTMTYDEIVIWNNIAIQYRRMGEHIEAFQIFQVLLECLEIQEMDEEDAAKLHPIILHNLARWYNREKAYEEAVRNCKLGVDLCTYYGKLYPLPYLLYQQAIGLKGMEKNKEAGELFQQSETILRVMKRGTANLETEIAIAL